MEFKQHLAHHFKNFTSSPFLFVGSGMSRRYMNIETWEQLLIRFCTLMNQNYTQIKSQSNGDLAMIASHLASHYSDSWWNSSIKGDKDKTYEAHLQKQDSPLKIEISDYLKYKHNNIIEEYKKEIVLLSNSKIDGIITTNWDLFLESIFKDFSVFIGQDDLFTSRNHGIAEIYKIHGCSSKPNSLVLTNEDYTTFRRKNPYLSSKLLTIFIEHPIIFLGYSLTDPHILEILTEIVNCFPDNKIDTLKDNIIFVEWAPEAQSPNLTESVILKNLPVTLIKTNSFLEIFEVLSEIKRRISAQTFRQIKDELYELVLTNDPKGRLYVKEATHVDNSEESKEFVIGYGAISEVKRSEKMSTKGIVGVSRDDIIRDVIFDNKEYDSHAVVFEAFPEIIKGKANIPIFKYLNQAGCISENGYIKTDGLCQQLKDRIKDGIERFRSSKADESRSKKIAEVQLGVEELYNSNSVNLNLFLRMAKFIPLEKIDLLDLEKILKTHADDSAANINKSDFVKIVCIYDYLKYSKKHVI